MSAPDEYRIGGGFVPCEACDGTGEIVFEATGFDTFERVKACPDCEGWGSVWRDDEGEP